MFDPRGPGLVLIEHVHLLITLHRIIAAGKGDDPEADDLRDSMDASWYQLRDFEIDAVNGRSADLYSIGTTRTAGSDSETELLHEVQSRIASGMWPKVLEFVREREMELSPKRVAVLRGLAWANMQLFEPAIEFLREAMRISRGDKDVRLLLLSCLVQAGYTSEAVQVAEESTGQSTIEFASSM